jgi:hypothetical protein
MPEDTGVIYLSVSLGKLLRFEHLYGLTAGPGVYSHSLGTISFLLRAFLV